MTLAETRSAAGPLDAPVPAPKIVRQRRMRPGLLGLAVLLVALGGLGSAWAVNTVRATGDYLAVARPVSVGSMISEADLTTVQLAGGQGLSPVPADQIDRVVGRYAGVALVPGTLLTPDQLTTRPLLGPEQQQISLGLKRSQVPAKRLRPGDEVLLVATPSQAAAADGPEALTAAARYQAVVVDTGGSDDAIVVYLAVASRDAPAVVTLAAHGRVAVVLKPGS